jgi:hypothetical protein
MPRKHKKSGGGIFDSLGQTFSNFGSSFSQGAKNMWDKTKQNIPSMPTMPSMPSMQSMPNQYQSQTPNYSYQQTSQVSALPVYKPSTGNYGSNYGGTKRKRSRMYKRGGSFRDNVSLNNLASHAAPFSGNTAQAHSWVGGKTSRRRKSSRKSKTSKKRTNRTRRH